MERRVARKPGRLASVRWVSDRSAGSSLGLAATSTPYLIRELRRGLLFRALEFLSSESSIPVGEIAGLVGIPPRTLARRRVSGRLAPAESERLLRISRIFELAVDLFNGEVAEAVAWLRTPRRTLASSTPLAYSATELGAREVETLIGQLEHGVFP
jgi:putative toxin-antitoxin system antitoxin component (TIGR02293 family)